ncbi:MAG: flagellar hook-length control protein FliK [Methylobacter sp.]
MVIESANLSSLVSSSAAVESVAPPLPDGASTSEGFSGALVAQIELLSAMKTEGATPVQIPDSVALQGVGGPLNVADLSVGKVDTQDFSALLGNDLPPSYKTKGDVDHEAALAAVTDTLKYIGLETSAGEKVKVAEQNMKDVIAMATPVPQSTKNAIATAVPAEQSMQSTGEKAVPVEQDIVDVTAEAGQSLKDVVVVDAPVQMGLGQGNDKPDKKQAEGDAQITVIENNGITEGLLAAAVIVPPAMQAEQAKATHNLVSANADQEAGLLPFTKPPTATAGPNQSANISENRLQSETVFRLPVSDRQSFNLNDFQNSGQAEKAGRIEQQVLSLEGEKTLPQVGSDMAPPNRIVDNKTDVPAMSKPLSHPEWSKDMGERIVWMSSRAIPSAEIRLNPPHMGPISVRVDVADDQATVVFTAQHAAVRETLEASIPKLREMMSAQHLNLVEANVFQGPASDQGRPQSQNFAQTAGDRRQVPMTIAGDEIGEVEQEVASGRAVVSKGLLSIYA